MTKRTGFAVSAYFIVVMALLVWATGKYFVTVSRVTKIGGDDSVFNNLRNKAERGMIEAEAWLIRMFEGHEIPRTSGWGSGPLDRIEAALPSGSKFDKKDELSISGISVFIADASYDISMFPDGRPPYAIPVMPHKLPGTDDGTSELSGHYYYYIRSSAEIDTIRTVPTFEEVVCVLVENGTGRYIETRKIFRRYSTASRRAGS